MIGENDITEESFVGGKLNPTDAWHWMTLKARLAYCPDKIVYVVYGMVGLMNSNEWLGNLEGEVLGNPLDPEA